MELLKVGDRLYNEKTSRWNNDVYYSFATVERLTQKQAILSNGVRLVNEPRTDWHGEIGYSTYGDHWNKWYIETPDTLLKAKKEKERQKVSKWFSEKKFTDEEKIIVYNTFRELNMI